MKNKIRACIILGILFIINTILVILGKTSWIDTFVREKVFSLYGEVADKAMHTFTFMGSTPWVVGLILVVFAILVLRKRRNAGLSLAGCLLSSTLLNNIVKIIIRRPRPTYITVVENTFSYPSGHTMGATMVYGFLMYLIIKCNIPKKYKIIYSGFLCLLIILVGMSRIYLGAHFFTDVYGGALLSSLLLVIFSIIDEKKELV